MPQPVRPRVAGYARVSTDAQAQQETHEAQVAWLKDRAAREGWDLTLYVEPGLSGETVAARPQLRALLEGVRAGRFDLVAVRAIDRLGRSQRFGEWAPIADTLADARVRVVHGTGETDFSRPGDAFVFGIFSGQAGFERAMIRERTRAGQHRACAEGRKALGHDPLGLRYEAKTRTWRVDEEEAATVRRLYELAAEGLPMREIERRCRVEGLHSRAGAPISHTQIGRILRRRAYVGEWGVTLDRQDYKIPVPVVVDPALWDRVQERLGAPTARPRGNGWELAGLVWCAACGLPAYQACVSRRPEYAQLTCGSSHAHHRSRGRKPCGGHWKRDEVGEAVWAAAVQLLSDPAVLKRARRRKAPVTPAGDLEGARRAVSRLDARIATLALRWGRAASEDPAFAHAIEALREDRAAAVTRVAELERANASMERVRRAASDAASQLAAWKGALASADGPLRRAVLQRLMPRRGQDGVFLGPGKWVLRALAPSTGSGTSSREDGSAPVLVGVELSGALRVG